MICNQLQIIRFFCVCATIERNDGSKKKEAVFIFVYQNVQKEDNGRSLIFVYLTLRNQGARH
ncbi:hypothetical protein GKC77_03570 [Lactobacillus ruminis]|uniref:Uncharacterized protein n=1 Tax=Ligilactobacillus ruminis TaxID=1623 RepID=A0A6A8HVA9_9LACO|nr:hypothetical protein [Ligilactobacillus ruminis]MSA22372.1 hypothetical protein [Ligilactobacillus ruminis]MSA24411.1 hypothetical protein [Ligilactobacillus ruminis]MSA34666.1 hypothetical protein [Ligilactobacillus ruminis]MSA41000.1 hypothetical protein [Ligilactobacillus ruminis]